jgi:hypothetical protein
VSGLLLAAGSSCSGEPDHLIRHWAVDGSRRLHICPTRESGLTTELKFALATPIPGDASPMTIDAHRIIVLLDDASAYRLDRTGRPAWRPLEERSMKSKLNDPALTAAGTGCGGTMWVVDRERCVWTWRPAGKALLADAPVPGVAGILAVDAVGRTVFLQNGERLAWLAGVWTALSGLLAADGLLKVRVVRGTTLAPPFGDVTVGTILNLPEADARRLIGLGTVAPMPHGSAVA